MIVDVHTHLPSHKEMVPPDEMQVETTMRSGETVQLTNSIDDYLRDMGPVDKAFIFGIAPRPWRPDERVLRTEGWADVLNHNDVAAEAAKYAPDKIIPFMSLHPLDPKWNDEYDRCVGDLGVKGIKLGPNYQDFDPTGKEAFELFARLEADGIPIVFHQGTSPMTEAPLTYAHPLTSDKVAMAFPNLTMVLAHLAERLLGGGSQAPQRVGRCVSAILSTVFVLAGNEVVLRVGCDRQDFVCIRLASDASAGQYRPLA